MTPTKALKNLNARRVAERNRRIVATATAWDRWASKLSARLLASAIRGRDVGAVLDDALVDARYTMERQLTAMLRWSWTSATLNLVAAVPMPAWLQRLSPIGGWSESEKAVVEVTGPKILSQNLFKRILNGSLSRDAAMEAIRRLEFPAPDPIETRRILTATTARDGLDAMTRIVTVAQPDKRKLLDLLSGGTPGDDKASLKDALAPKIDALVGDVRYKAMRIARTESIRIAEAAQRQAWTEIADLMEGVRTFTMDDTKVRDEHRHWHNKLYLRTGGGEFRAEDGELLPDLPAGPNCRCWSTPELTRGLTNNLPPVDYGVGYETSLARFRQSEFSAV
jgi:hypothetical protein